MKAKVCMLAAVCLGLSGPAPAAEEPPLRLYMPRAVVVARDSLDLGSISVIRGGDEALARKASAVAMGRAPWPKEKIMIDRQTILSRLACSGIEPSRVQITGAERIAVGRDEKVIEAEEVLQAAETFLETDRPGPTGCRWRLCAMPEGLVVPAGGDVKLQAGIGEKAPPGHVKVRVAAAAGDGPPAAENLLFKLVYPLRQAVTTEEIPAAGVITSENTRIETVMVEQPRAADWFIPYGQAAARSLPAGTVIRPEHLRSAKRTIVVRRNQAVVMKVSGFGFTVTAIGRALQDGRGGELIKVRNVDTQRIVTAKVASDGTVEPVFEEEKK